MNTKKEHPSLETLLALTLDDLPNERAEAVREHLIDCDECRSRVQELLDTSSEPPESIEPLSRFEKRAAWRDLQSALEEEGLDAGRVDAGRVDTATEPKREPESDRAPAMHQHGGGPPYGQLAATALLAFGLGFFVFRMSVEPPPKDPSDPPPGSENPSDPAETLFSQETVRGPKDPKIVRCVPSGGDFLWKIETPGRASPNAVYEIEITNQDGDVVLRNAGTRPDDFGRLSMRRPERELPDDGDYTIRIFATGSDEPLSTFPLRVECE